jgi:hypothetical protein
VSVWWDNNTKKYHSSLVHKVFYVWCWPVFQWFLYNCLKPEQAHWLAIHVAIPTVGRIDRIWSGLVTGSLLALLIPLAVIIRLLLFLPWFTYTLPPDEDGE